MYVSRRSATLSLAICLYALTLLADGQPASSAVKAVSFAMLEDYDKGDDLDDIARDFALMKELGVTTWRGSFGWDDYEPTRGRADFGWLEQFITRARREGITLRPYVAYTPDWAASGGGDGQAWNDPPRSIEAWSSFVERLSAMLARHPNVASLEIYNEQNVPQWWEGTVDQYADVLRRGVSAINRRAPGLSLLPGGLVYPDVAWIEDVCQSRQIRSRIDAIALHAYPETWTPADVTVENYLGEGFRSFLRSAQKSCGRKPIWINEAGFATTPGRTERDQANWWARAIATFLAAPEVEHIGIYEVKDLPPDKPVIGDAPNYHLGITDARRRPKMAFATIDLLTDLLDTGTLIVADHELSVAVVAGETAAVERHVFVTPRGTRVLFVWSRARTTTVTVRTGVRGGRATEYLLDGTKRPPFEVPDGALSDLTLKDGVARIFTIEP